MLASRKIELLISHSLDKHGAYARLKSDISKFNEFSPPTIICALFFRLL